MPASNNPSVGLATRRWLERLERERILLDPISRNLIERAVTKCLRVSPAGLVHDLARDLGARPDLAVLAGSVSEVFYAVCSLTDDLQDGDTEDYLGPISPALRLNIQSHLLCLVAVRAGELAREIGGEAGMDLVVDVYRTGAAMLNGQRMELIRDPWNAEVYETVARLSAGEQFGTHVALGALAARVDPAPWRHLGRAYGTLLQLVADYESADPRLTELPAGDVKDLWSRLTGELERDSLGLGDHAHEQALRLLKRCPRAI
jgi:hypothetical protein